MDCFCAAFCLEGVCLDWIGFRACVCICLFVCLVVRMCMCMNVCMYICMYVYMCVYLWMDVVLHDDQGKSYC